MGLKELRMRGLSRNQLKLIAITAMVCDHLAWGFLDFMSPLAQVLHVIGRFTLPIMCFFIAEGFRHTSDLRRYIERMVSFWILSMVPFYIFFSFEYDYRQNIIFDLLLALLALAVLEHKAWNKVIRGLLLTLLIAVSMWIGGWIIMPILYTIAFYYGRNFKEQAKWIVILTVLLQVILQIAIYINNYVCHFSHYEWQWYERVYLLGFVLPLLVLRYYNGERGKPELPKYFFYAFYPLHFCVLASLQYVLYHFELQQFYIWTHVVALLFSIFILLLVCVAKPSRAQVGILMFAAFGIVYEFGFLMEITSCTTEAFLRATSMEYFGEVMLILGVTMFIREFCHLAVPYYVFAIECVAGMVSMYWLSTTETDHFFYSYVGVDYNGPFPKMDIAYGTGFYLFISYVIVISIFGTYKIVKAIITARGVNRKRLYCLLWAIVFAWLPYLIKISGLTGGYEVPALGIAGAIFFVALCIIRYDVFDSVSLASTNALNHGNEGVIVVGTDHRLLFFNKIAENIFGRLMEYDDAYRTPELKSVLQSGKRTIQVEERTYEVRVEDLLESGTNQGRMLWLIDMTDHYSTLNEVREEASRDPLTGAYVRTYYEKEVTSILERKLEGTFMMLDLDNFKHVNDSMGHKAGDEVLKLFAKACQSAIETKDYCARIGGDEFSLFIVGNNQKEEVAAIAKNVIESFDAFLAKTDYAGSTSVSIGIATTDHESKRIYTYDTLYSRADKALYLAKNSGKKTYNFY